LVRQALKIKQRRQFFVASNEREIVVNGAHAAQLVTESGLVKSRLGD
jgi:hypothetical protein